MKGINKPMTKYFYNGIESCPKWQYGKSVIGRHLMEKSIPGIPLIEQAKRILNEIRSMVKPNLPK